MMKSKFRVVLGALVVVCALGAAGSSAASAALPEFVPGGGSSFPIVYSGDFEANTWSVPGRGYIWGCRSGKMVGEITGAKSTAHGTVTFFGCKSEKKTCRSEGSKGIEEIVTQPLSGTLVYIDKTKKTVGILFKPTTGTAVAKLVCFGAIVEVRGSIVMPITPTNTLSESFTVTAGPGTTSYENETGKHTAELTSDFGLTFEPTFWTFTSSFFTAHAIEVKA